MIKESRLHTLVKTFTKGATPLPIRWGEVTDALWPLMPKKITPGSDEIYRGALIQIRNYFSQDFYVLDASERWLDYIPPESENFWLRFSYPVKQYLTRIPSKYILDHFDPAYSHCLLPDYQPGRLEGIKEALDKGVAPMSFTPIHTSFYLENNTFCMTDGINRVKAFAERRIPYINALLGVYWSFKLSESKNPPIGQEELSSLVQMIIHESKVR